jgi:hypothetical protein
VARSHLAPRTCSLRLLTGKEIRSRLRRCPSLTRPVDETGSISYETDDKGRVLLHPRDKAVLGVAVRVAGFRAAKATGVRVASGCATAVSFALTLVHPICTVEVVGDQPVVDVGTLNPPPLEPLKDEHR